LDTQIHVIAEEKDSHLWNAFIESSPYSTPYHLWEFGHALSLTYGYKKYYLVATNGDKVIGAFPLIYVKSRLFGSKLLSLPFCEYGGPLVSPNSGASMHAVKSLFEEVLTIASSLNVDYIEIRNPLLHGEIMEKKGYNVVRRYVTFVIDLSCEREKLWRSLDKKTRNSTRKAMKNELNVYEVSKEDDLKEYFSLYLKTQKKHGSPPHSFKLFQDLFSLNVGKSIRILMAEYHSKPIAGIVLFYNKRKIYWWGGSSDPKFKHLNATNLLLWKIIEGGVEIASKLFDLGRTRRGTSIYHFKSGWGGKEVILQDYVCFLNDCSVELPDPEQSRYSFLSRLWSLMPVSLAKKIGPKIMSGIGL